MAISRAPYVLVIHLKRFAYANMNAKLNKVVRFTTELNFPCTDQHLVDGKMMNDGNNMSMSMIKYQLYAVIVHCGSSTHSGHYYAYVKVHTSNLLVILFYDILYYIL
jgi:ubiquitin carboxyl-terminal hydrolase 36/42